MIILAPCIDIVGSVVVSLALYVLRRFLLPRDKKDQMHV